MKTSREGLSVLKFFTLCTLLSCGWLMGTWVGEGWGMGNCVQNILHKNLFQLKNNSCDLKKKNYAKEHAALKANYSFTFKATWWESSIVLSGGASSGHGKGSSFAASADEWSSVSFAFDLSSIPTEISFSKDSSH